MRGADHTRANTKSPQVRCGSLRGGWQDEEYRDSIAGRGLYKNFNGGKKNEALSTCFFKKVHP